MKKILEEIAEALATEAGGFTLWIGAGASIALTNRATPTWSGLVSAVAAAHGAKSFGLTGDFPSDLENLSQSITHQIFRKELRQRLIEPIVKSISIDNAVCQALIGARASTIVSFNLEFFSSFPLTSMKCGAQFVARTFRERSAYSMDLEPKAGGGVVSAPIYFPHGLLDYGAIVMTKSEYDRHQGSLAVSTAVHLAIGGDLVILGMSLGDAYLRDSILQSRRWLRNIYWLGDKFDYLEWARVANVTLVPAPHDTVWSILSEAVLANDSSGKMKGWIPKLRDELPEYYEDMREWTSKYTTSLHDFGAKLASTPEATSDHVTTFASHCIDIGIDVPSEILADPRYLL
jgi:hypothetical protein